MKYDCMKPEWADNEPCPLDTGELENCSNVPFIIDAFRFMPLTLHMFQR